MVTWLHKDKVKQTSKGVHTRLAAVVVGSTPL